MEKRENAKDGSITIEACVALILFMFLVLMLYSFFYIFEAQMKIKSNLIRTAESLSLDPFVSSRVNSKIIGEDASVGDLLASFSVTLSKKNSDFITEDAWYSDSGTASGSLQTEAENRFVAMYNGGDKSAMEESLRMLRVVDGAVKIKAKVENGELNLEATYELKYLFDYPAFKMPDLKMQQTTVSRLWN
jgi:hypothetical protein